MQQRRSLRRTAALICRRMCHVKPKSTNINTNCPPIASVKWRVRAEVGVRRINQSTSKTAKGRVCNSMAEQQIHNCVRRRPESLLRR